MGTFTFEETNLLCIYNTGSRTGLIETLTEMRGELSPEEAELRELTDSALGKLQAMSDTEFSELALYPDFFLIQRNIVNVYLYSVLTVSDTASGKQKADFLNRSEIRRVSRKLFKWNAIVISSVCDYNWCPFSSC